MESEITLGTALAYLMNGKSASKTLNGNSRALVQSLEKRRNEIIAQNSHKSILSSVPKHPCEFDNIFLDKNHDFYIVKFLFESADSKEGKCRHLIVHLNDCYLCFQEFANVLRDFCTVQK